MLHCVLCVPKRQAEIVPEVPLLGSNPHDVVEEGIPELVSIVTVPNVVVAHRRRPTVEYAKSYLMTTRFNTETWKQHREFMDMGSAGKGVHACYCSPMGISSHIVDAACSASPGPISGPNSNVNGIKLLVLEMHNDLNTIMGIGAVFARSHYRRYSMYVDDKYNVCAFVGPYRIARTEMTEKEEIMMVMLDTLCFRGKRHMKRLRGLTLFPDELCVHVREHHRMDLRAEIQSMFRRRFSTQAQPSES
jgi:hypothetical protein